MRATELSAAEHAARERILTQPEPSKVHQRTEVIVVKHGDVFMLANEVGDVPLEGRRALGLFYHDTRFPDGFELTVRGIAPVVLSAASMRGFEAVHDLANPPLGDGRAETIPKNTVAIRRRRLIRGGVIHELLTFTNYGRDTVRLPVHLAFRARFEDLFALKGFTDDAGGTVRAPKIDGGDRMRGRHRPDDGPGVRAGS